MSCPNEHPNECFYCDASLSPRHEHDHIPPQRQGGTDTVATCINCHDLKDRINLGHWSIDMQVRALRECGPLGRIYLAKAFGIHGDTCPSLFEAATP